MKTANLTFLNLTEKLDTFEKETRLKIDRVATAGNWTSSELKELYECQLTIDCLSDERTLNYLADQTDEAYYRNIIYDDNFVDFFANSIIYDPLDNDQLYANIAKDTLTNW